MDFESSREFAVVGIGQVKRSIHAVDDEAFSWLERNMNKLVRRGQEEPFTEEALKSVLKDLHAECKRKNEERRSLPIQELPPTFTPNHFPVTCTDWPNLEYREKDSPFLEDMYFDWHMKFMPQMIELRIQNNNTIAKRRRCNLSWCFSTTERPPMDSFNFCTSDILPEHWYEDRAKQLSLSLAGFGIGGVGSDLDFASRMQRLPLFGGTEDVSSPHF
eukprot:8322013-Karenia_brevis.AAC.1